MDHALSEMDVRRFERDGFLVARGFAASTECRALRTIAEEALEPLQGPAELESDLGYPGAPRTRSAEGGYTPRRLLHAYARDRRIREWATSERIRAHLCALLGGAEVMLSQSHHNCIMTKHPGYSSATHWHQDIRYWSFDRPELVTAWLALGPEHDDNGALAIIPGSHRLTLDRGRLDRDLFLREALLENQRLIAGARTLELAAGDVLFFHCRLFHAAGRNRTDRVKFSLVFTYHGADNAPIPGTRSARYPSIPLDASTGRMDGDDQG